jgi:site-specific DNA-methyltransferase (adenine-specific)
MTMPAALPALPALPRPYFAADGVTLYHGDSLALAPALLAAGLAFDAVVTDPPYNETSLEWDVWPQGWPEMVKPLARQLWCFGSLRMFWERRDEFAGWKLAQDVIWEKQNGSGFDTDRFRRVHEFAVHFYHGGWDDLHKQVPKVAGERRPEARIRQSTSPKHRGEIAPNAYEYGDDRLQKSVITVANCHGYAVNETQKPEGIVAPLLAYSVPPGGSVFDPFAGSGTVLAVARAQGKRAVGIEKRESQCAEIVRRLGQGVLPLETKTP